MSATSSNLPPSLQTDIQTLEEDGYTISAERDGSTVYVVFEDYSLPAKYSPDQTDLLVKVPLPYPDSKIDMFWTELDVRGPNGLPEKAGHTHEFIGREWRRFSWHRNEDWNPAYHDLIDHMEFVKARFSEYDN